jgi:hypothetical protein
MRRRIISNLWMTGARCGTACGGGATGVRASLKRAQGTRVSLAEAAGRLLRRQVDLKDANPSPTPRPLAPSIAQRMTDSQVARERALRRARLADSERFLG